MNLTEIENRKGEIALRLTELANEEAHELIDRPIGKPIKWIEYVTRTEEIDAERKKLRKELFELCSGG
jgi:hypothetical protein